ncbi:MAG: right-handed parallel beta-helix repeat-containing protein [Planctomycetota bacterium]|nr:MAG: right-handed parallel beta-helix repeat-containing protein [Planctomycetota bacterium]
MAGLKRAFARVPVIVGRAFARVPVIVGRAFARLGWTVVACALAACSTGGGGGGESDGDGSSNGPGPDPPTGLTLATANGQVLVAFLREVEAESYNLYWSLAPGVTPESGTEVAVEAPPHVVSGLPGGESFYAVVTSVGYDGEEGSPTAQESVDIAQGGEEKYFPPWHDVQPTSVISFDYDPGQSSTENGADLRSMIGTLQPGDRLEVGAGTWTIDSLFNIQLTGTAQAPIWIVARDGATPVITRSNASQNTINIGQGNPCRYVCLRGFEITSGSIAIRMYDCRNVWIDQCHVHDCAANAIVANSQNTDHLYFTRNEVHSTGDTGEGFYIGGNNGSPIAHDCVIALNHVYDTAGTQGDGIEIKQGSWGNWIAENIIHDTQYPCILTGGTNGQPVNLIEKNLCWGSENQVMQIQGEAIVRNNVMIGGSYAFYSSDHQGATRDLVVVHNTIINTGHAARMNDWSGRPGMVFSNNVVYSQTLNSIWFPQGSSGVEAEGNVVKGPVAGLASGYSIGNGLSDFADVTWDGSHHDATPAPLGALIGMGAEEFAEVEDVSGAMRLPPLDTGAADG